MSEPRQHGMFVDPAEDPRELLPTTAGERGNVLDYLQRYRLTLQLKCEGLDAEQMARRSVPPSSLSLLGLLRHLAMVEHTWFQRALQGRDEPMLYTLDGDRDHEFTGAVADQDVVDEAWATWRREVAAADEWLATDVPMDAEVPWHGGTVSVRDVLVHMVEEYARHVGHADLLRECLDGRTGE